MKVLSDEGSGTYESVIEGVEWAVKNGAHVINLSLGGPGGYGFGPLAQAVDNAVKSGVVVAVAAGNSGPDFNTISEPGDARLAITVGSVDKDRVLSYWSSRGPTLDGRVKPDVAAYGANIMSLMPGGGYEAMSGTSMATPHVAGIAALLVQEKKPDPLLVKEALKKTAIDLGYGPNSQGAGLVDMKAALDYIEKAMNLVIQEVYPGETAVYDYTLYNRGNVDDSYRMTQWIADHNLKYTSQSTLPSDSVATMGEVALMSGDSIEDRARVKIASDWAGMEDTTYTIHLRATSLADELAIDEDRAAVRVKATKRSMAEFIRQQFEDLKDEIRLMESDGATKKSLFAKADSAYQKHLEALEYIKEGNQLNADNTLEATDNKTHALENEVQAKAKAGKLTTQQANDLLSEIKSIREHIATCKKTSVHNSAP